MTTNGLTTSRRPGVARVVVGSARTFVVTPECVLAAQLVVIAGLVLAYIAAKSLHVLGGHDNVFGLGPLFDLDRELNVPSIYSAAAILVAAALLALTGAMQRKRGAPDVPYWFLLAGIFLFLTYDEAFSVHEEVGEFLRDVLGNRRAVHLNWSIAGVAFLVVVSVASLRFVFRLARRTRGLMIGSGVVFVAGALGFELLGGLRHDTVSSTLANPDAVYFALVAAEESCEMLGIALFNYALLDHLRANFDPPTFSFGRS